MPKIIKKQCIFLGNLPMTQIRDSNRFWGKKKSSKFLDFLSWLDSYMYSTVQYLTYKL